MQNQIFWVLGVYSSLDLSRKTEISDRANLFKYRVGEMTRFFSKVESRADSKKAEKSSASCDLGAYCERSTQIPEDFKNLQLGVDICGPLRELRQPVH